MSTIVTRAGKGSALTWTEADANFTNLNTDKAATASPTFTGNPVLPTPFTIGAVSMTATGTQLNYVAGVTSAIQTQMDLKAPAASPTFTGTVVLPSGTSIANVSATEISYLDGVTSAIQTQLNAKAPIDAPTFTNSVALPTTWSVNAVTITPTGAELNYVAGVTSAIQTQIDTKLAKTVEVVTATNVIAAGESGSTFFLSSATEFVSTLPAPAAGLRFTFIVAAAPSGASYTVVTNSTANIIIGQQQSVAGDAGDFGTADDTITFVDGQSVAGDRVDVISDGTSWFAYAQSKLAAGITFTQVS